MNKNVKIIITYKSNYGSSHQYALWLSESLKCPAVEIDTQTAAQLSAYEIIVHIGGLYAGGISGFKILKKQLAALNKQKIILCMVGMANPEEFEQYNTVYEANVLPEYRTRIKPFALRGNQTFSQMSTIHRIMMKVPKAQIQKIPAARRTEEQKTFLETFGTDITFVNKDYLDKVIAYIHTLF